MTFLKKARYVYLSEQKGIYFRNFGAFQVQRNLNPPKGVHCYDNHVNQDGNYCTDKELIQYEYKMIPVFLPEGNFLLSLTEYLQKNNIDPRIAKDSVFKSKHNTIFFNPGPLGLACFFPRALISDAVEALFRAVSDLAFRGIFLIK